MDTPTTLRRRNRKEFRLKKEEMKAELLKYICKNNSVSYAELQWLFEQKDYAYKGELMSCSDQCEHVIFWSGWSAEAFDIVGELLRDGLVHREPTHFLVYMIDGGSLGLPLVKKAVQYKTDHWLPVVFMSGPDREQEKA